MKSCTDPRSTPALGMKTSESEVAWLPPKSVAVAFGTGLGEVAGKVFRIGHLGSLTDVMALSGIATAEMVMADLGLPVTLGSGVAAAQDHYRAKPAIAKKEAA